MSQRMSKMAVRTHAVMGTSVMTGCSGWPNHVPLSRLFKRRGGLRCDPTATPIQCCSLSLKRSVKGGGGCCGSGDVSGGETGVSISDMASSPSERWDDEPGDRRVASGSSRVTSRAKHADHLLLL